MLNPKSILSMFEPENTFTYGILMMLFLMTMLKNIQLMVVNNVDVMVIINYHIEIFYYNNIYNYDYNILEPFVKF